MQGMIVRKIDLGRLFIVPVFSVLLYFIIRKVMSETGVLSSATCHELMMAVYRILLVCFYVLIIGLYLFRGPAVSSSRSVMANLIAVCATFLPFAIPLLAAPEPKSDSVLLASTLFMLAGTVIAVYALACLGRSISIIPQARKLVRTGPYRFIRHPLYAGELTGIFGVVLAGTSISGFSIFLLLALMQAYRAKQEERLLGEVFPEYREYSQDIARFVPGIY